MHGWLILDKPLGLSSVQASARVKRLTKQKKIGHAGTLDPLATGVLPLALGEATKTVPYLEGADKCYRFTIAWGSERSTDDLEGEVTATSELKPTQEALESVLPRFLGRIEQVPPAYSAIQVDGQRAYAMARAGQEVVLKPRPVDIYSIDIESFNENDAVLHVHCGKGTYVRSLARDIGRALGCLGHVSKLRRTKVGKFDETQAISLEKLEEIVHNSPHFLLPVESALDDIPALHADSDAALRFQRGQKVNAFHFGMRVQEVAAQEGEAFCVMHNGKLLAIVTLISGELQPVRVFNL